MPGSAEAGREHEPAVVQSRSRRDGARAAAAITRYAVVPMTRPCGRLAPTPSGLLHLGNVLAFGAAWLSVRAAGGRLLLRIEDVDTGRARVGVERAIRRDLEWLGLTWDAETLRQSARDYRDVLSQLAPHVYRCTCTRAQLKAGGGVYAGTCRDRRHTTGAVRLRLPPGGVRFDDRRSGPRTVDPTVYGDPVLVRRDGLVGYNLAVVADDIADGVTEVVRGGDLLDYTAVQIRLYEALGARPPTWLHTPLVLGPDGAKLSKSHGSDHVGALRDAGHAPADIWRRVLPWLGLPPCASLDEGLPHWRRGQILSRTGSGLEWHVPPART
jgi:glutamyl/glutaminyl-tRNA synthetase